MKESHEHVHYLDMFVRRPPLPAPSVVLPPPLRQHDPAQCGQSGRRAAAATASQQVSTWTPQSNTRMVLHQVPPNESESEWKCHRVKVPQSESDTVRRWTSHQVEVSPNESESEWKRHRMNVLQREIATVQKWVRVKAKQSESSIEWLHHSVKLPLCEGEPPN